LNLLETFKTRTRHPMRPRASDVIQRLFADFRDCGSPGSSLILGEGHLDKRRVYVVAQQKPKPEDFNTPEAVARLNWGMMNADEHAKVFELLRKLQASGPHEDALLLSFVDTYGADISMYSAQRLQAFFIGHLIRAYLTVPIRTISIVLGEGGSGGALAVQVADRTAVLEDAMYATAPPESLAAIIFRDPERIEDALTISKGTARHLKHYGVVDTIIPQTKKISDAEQMTRHISEYLDRTIKELFRKKLDKLMVQRREAADTLGVMHRGRFYGIKRFIERPLKQLQKPPQDIKVITAPSGGVQVSDNYGVARDLKPGQDYVRCGEERLRSTGSGCGEMIPLEEYMANHQVCPNCGKRHVLDAAGWINALADTGTFHELFRNITVYDCLLEDDIHDYYKDFLEKQKERTTFTESLVTATATIHGYSAVLSISDFAFAGGSMGVVFGEKFRLAAMYALRRGFPLISVCCSGGARLYEGIVALMQMTKTVAAVQKLKEAGIPYISILADPATGGAIASYAALGDVCLAEPNALVIFTGPRVMESRGFEVQEDLVRSDSLLEVSASTLTDQDYYGDIRGVQEVVQRRDMSRTVARYLEFFARVRQGYKPPKGQKPYRRRRRPEEALRTHGSS
jgi:acetyl-CoA carboxylase carboxyl transferase beta subunit